MKERLDFRDYRFIAVCLALLAGSIWYAAGNFYRAFPEASIDFRLNRADAQLRAGQFLAAQGYRLNGYRDASSFNYDDDTKTFLERELGLEKANQLMGSRIRLWRWSFRWFRPLQKEEFRADITPGGEFAGFTHEIAEDAARPDIAADQARTLAEDFLRTRAHRDPATLDFVESSSVTRPHRVDRVFTWKERDFDLHDATYRLDVTMLGNEVGGYSEYLKIPDRWTRDYARLRSKNDEASTFDTLAVVGLLIGLLAVLVIRVRRQDVRWRRAALIGVIGMGLAFLASLNEFPLAEFGYRTTDGYGSFLAQRLIQSLGSALGTGGLLFVIAAGAEVLYREAYPDKVSVGCLFNRRGLRTKRFFLGAILGVTLCAIFLAYQTGFYIVANKLGAWSPAEVPYDDLLNTRFPWLYVLLGGYLPAISEEFGFRMFAIPFLRKIVRWLPAAIVLAGFIWGFGHAGYPNQPFFIRGLEVGIGGIALGLIMLRWGILPTLIWHYSVDAMYSALLLLRSHSLYFQLSGAASAGVFVIPILIALAAYWRRGGFEPVTGLLNGDEPGPVDVPVETEATPVITRAYSGLSVRLRVAALAIFAAGLAAALIPTARFGDSPRYKLTADQARAPADAFLRDQGIDPAGYLHVTDAEVHWGGDDSLAALYFVRHGSLRTAAKLFEQYRPVQFWGTRYFKSLEKEEFLVTVQPETGRVMGYNRQLPDDRAGADLSQDAARQIAADFAKARGFDVDAMDLKESTSQKQKARRDYTLEWEARAGDPRNLDEVHYRVSLQVAGDRIASLRAYWKIPEDFERTRDRENFISIGVWTLRIAVLTAGVIFAVWMLIRQIRRGAIPWRRILWLAAIPTATTIVGVALALRISLYKGYPTAIPFNTYMAINGAAMLMIVALAYVVYGAAIAFLLSFFPESDTVFRRARRVFSLDALVLLLLAVGLGLLCQQFAAVLTDRLPAVALPEVAPPGLIGLPAPAVAALAGAIQAIFTHGALLAVIALAWSRLKRRWLLAPLTLLAATYLVPTDVRTPAEFGLQYLIALAPVAGGLIFAIGFARRNYLAYMLAIWVGALYPAFAELLHSGNAALQTQAWVLAGAGLLAIAWAAGPGLIGAASGNINAGGTGDLEAR